MKKIETPHLEARHYEDEIDLFELWRTLVTEWKTIAMSLIVILALALGYVLTAKPVYELQAVLIKPYANQLSDLKLLPSVIATPDELYNEFGNQLTGYAMIEAVLQHPQYKQAIIQGYGFSGAPNQLSQISAFLQKNIMISFPGKKTHDEMLARFNETIVKLDFFDHKQAASILKFLVTTANTLATEHLMAGWKDSLIKQLQAEKQHYDLMDKNITLQTKSEILRLKDSFDIAKKLGILSPVDPEKYGEKRQNNRTNIDVSMKSSLQGYWLGTTVLKAEIDRLKARKNNLAYSQALRDSLAKQRALESQLNLIKKVTFQCYAYKQPPVQPVKPIKPKKLLILAVASVMGLFLGIFIALIRGAYKKRQIV